jgi:gamma-glutamyltranspeptidase/glutathione hydrolase
LSETVVGERGMVSAPHRAAAEAGAAILSAGGNALEATIAAAATIAVVYPHMNGIGGDAFVLFAEPGKAPRVIDGSGAAGSRATVERYRKAGYEAIPARGPEAALTVAGAVSSWQLAYEAAQAMGGRMPRRDLLGDAIRRAREGIAASASQFRMTQKNGEELQYVTGFAATFLKDRKTPPAGTRMSFARLADTLDQLAHAGFADFYRGEVAAEIAADHEALQTPVTRADLEHHAARVVAPLSVEVPEQPAATVFSTPAPTQGIASLMILALFDRLKVRRGESFEHVHGLVEATKRAFAIRDAEVTDPADGRDLSSFLRPDVLAAEALAIDRKRAAPWPAGGGAGDTVWMGAIDRDGLAVSFIQSLYWEFGSGVVLPRTGILWQNRGASFSLDPGDLNLLRPGRKPFHTLTPALARFSDGRTMVYGSMGGEGQPQFQAAIFTRHARFGMDLAAAIAAPRWRLGRTWGATQTTLAVEAGFDPDLVAALQAAGHPVVMEAAYADAMGHAGAVVRRADGRLFGASDPRSDGAAVAA